MSLFSRSPMERKRRVSLGLVAIFLCGAVGLALGFWLGVAVWENR